VTLTKISLKHLTKEQVAEVAKLDQRYLGGLWSENAYEKEINSPNSTLLALSLEEKPIMGYGCLWSILEEAHITILLVHPDYHGQGLGQLLLFKLLEDAVTRGLERATLEVRASNEVALSLYEKFGFKIAGRRKNYYAQTGEDALILWRGDLAKPTFTADLSLWRRVIQDKLNKYNLMVGDIRY
jgi:ribosomal-protein-alanine N-acetyltransferase